MTERSQISRNPGTSATDRSRTEGEVLSPGQAELFASGSRESSQAQMKEGSTGPGRHLAAKRQLSHRRQLVLQDVLLEEGLLASRLAPSADSGEQLRALLLDRLPQNSAGTRERYALSVLRWFFPDGPGGIARQVWEAYEDGAIQRDVLRALYLRAEPLVGGCVAEALFPLAEGMQVPPAFFDRYLVERLGAPDLTEKTRKRLKQNLGKLGFLARSRGAMDRLAPVVPTKTAFLVLVHHLFAPDGPRTVELAHLFADPFWKYLGLKSEDAVRAILREADRVRWIGKYVVADQLEQLTTCFSLAELLRKKALL